MTINKKTLYGFIGCGMMGQEHIANAALAGAGVAVVFEPDADMRAATNARLAAAGLPPARFVESVAGVIAAPEVDALVITSPNYCHADQLVEIAPLAQTAGRALPILVEKPVCTNLADVARLKQFKAAYRAPVWVAMEYRYMPPIAALITQAHTQQHTGEPVMLSVREHRYPFLRKVNDWNRFNHNTGGTLVEKCCHFFDLMRLIMQDDPVRLYASGGQNHNHTDEIYDGQKPDILDNAYVIVDFPRGRRALLELCMFAEGSRYQEEISLVGPLGKLECLVPGPGRFWPAALGAAPVAQLVLSQRVWDCEQEKPLAHISGPQILEIPVDAALLAAGDHNGSTFYQHQNFLRTVRDHARVAISLDDGLKAVTMGLAAEQSAKVGVAIDLTAGDYQL